MPVRNFVVGIIAEKIRGTHIFNGLTGASETINQEALDHSRDIAQSAYLQVVQWVDWDRIMLEAHILHMRLDHKNWERTCGECIQAALLADDRNWLPGESDDYIMPDLKEERPIKDWPAEMATAIRYRRAS